MFEIDELKAKTLADLQQIAKTIGLKKTSQLKKLDLVYQVLDAQAENANNTPKKEDSKPKRKRVIRNSSTDKREVVITKEVKTEVIPVEKIEKPIGKMKIEEKFSVEEQRRGTQ